MASARTPTWKRWLIKATPFLFWACPAGNYHWRWDNRICYCRGGEHSADWNGGVLVDGKELFGEGCPPDYGQLIEFADSMSELAWGGEGAWERTGLDELKQALYRRLRGSDPPRAVRKLSNVGQAEEAKS